MSTGTSRTGWVTLFLILTTINTQAAEDIFSLSLQELSQIKVTIASRAEETSIDAPSSVTVITRQEIEQLGVRTLIELLNYVPGLQSYMSAQESNTGMIWPGGYRRPTENTCSS